MSIPHIPVLRLGKAYESFDTLEVTDHLGGEPLARISQANAGLIRRDLKQVKEAKEVLSGLTCSDLLSICHKAGNLFMEEDLPLGADGLTQSPGDYIECLSATSGLPHSLCKKNMAKIHKVFTEMPIILKGLTRGLELEILDRGIGEQGGVWMSYYPAADSLGVVLPSNSPGVNSIWMPAIPLKIPVLLKPGREEPWTPYRIIRAFIAAGCPAEAFGFYPTDHEGSAAILDASSHGLIFGDEKTIKKYSKDPNIQVHGPGWSKVLIGEDSIDRWRDYLDVLVESILANGGRSCINASALVVPRHGREIAEALADRLGRIQPLSRDHEEAVLSAFANPQFAEYIDSAINDGLQQEGAQDLTAKARPGPRKVESDMGVCLLPTVIWCETLEHPLANREFLFPYSSVVELPQSDMVEMIGPSLVVTAITEEGGLINALLRSPWIDRLNIGAIPTTQVEWDQPHEGNLFEFLYHRRSIQKVA